jgi:hypothetical protein
MMTMTNKSNNYYLKTPIPFFKNRNDASSPLGGGTTSEHDCNMSIPEVCYNLNYPDLQTHKAFLSPFAMGMPGTLCKELESDIVSVFYNVKF